MSAVTDPKIIAQLNAQVGDTKVTDQSTIDQLNSMASGSQEQPQEQQSMFGKILSTQLPDSLGSMPLVHLLGAAGRSIGRAGVSAANLIPGADIQMPQFLKQPLPNTLESKIGSALGSGVGYAGAAMAAGPEMMATLVSRAALGGLYGGATNGSDLMSRLKGGAEGALSSAVPDALLQTIGKGAPFIESLKQTAEKVGGKFGDLPIPYAFQDFYHKVLGNVPGSGVKGQVQEVSKAAQDKATGLVNTFNERSQGIQNDVAEKSSSLVKALSERAQGINQGIQGESDALLNTMKGDKQIGDIPKIASAAIITNRDAIKENNRALYEDLSNHAEGMGAKVTDNSNIREVAEKYLAKDKSGISKLDGDTKALLQGYIKPYGKPVKLSGLVDARGKPLLSTENTTGITFGDAIGFKKDFNEVMRGTKVSDPYKSMIYGDLSRAIKKDVSNAAQQSGDQGIIDKLKAADTDYATNVVPYNSPFVRSIAEGKKNLDTIHNDLLQDKHVSNKIMQDLPPEISKSLSAMKFKNAIQENPANGETNVLPEKFYQVFSKLTDKQKNKMFTPEEQSKFNSIGASLPYAKSLNSLNIGKSVKESTENGEMLINPEILHKELSKLSPSERSVLLKPDEQKSLADIEKSLPYLKDMKSFKSDKAVNENLQTGQMDANPERLYHEISKLSKKQKDRFFTEKEQDEIKSMGSLLPYIKPVGGQTGKIATAEVGASIMSALMHDPMMGIHVAAGIGATTVLSKILSKLLTNPRLREASMAAKQYGVNPNEDLAAALRTGSVGYGLSGNNQGVQQ